MPALDEKAEIMRRYTPGLALAALTGAAILAGAPDARPCSCIPPHFRHLTPDRLDDAPLNTRVRFESPGRAGGSGKERHVLRAHGSATEVDAVERRFATGGVAVIELAPLAPLAPSTQYEVAIVDPDEYPSTLVIGTFKTGTAADTAAPRLKTGGAAEAHRNVRFGGGDCSIRGPWIDVMGAEAEDPSRPKAQILWGVWSSDPSGKIDASKPPATILGPWRGRLTIGQRSLCDPHAFTLPDSGVFSFGIAPIDEAGNTGPMKVHRVDMSAATPEPRP
jgi:hypothetical protein